MQPYTPSRSDRVGIWIFVVAGIGIAIWTTVAATLRVIEVVVNRDVPVLAEFGGTPADAPIGPGGAPVTVGLDQAVLTVSGLPPRRSSHSCCSRWRSCSPS
ncbi:hypothetical protein [Protaetiibacter mangrovi]|uniref:Uncharacterized protein n=1 Tax=Protaetiibacter mangrovi TaxID=2970926 RepID=A0ABT1ZCT2_9MICO|nr:hypothetical protein [Protaetiibacter mangrovi]MCS0498499.1 hypothetical protein [Protaetiibacter mangrovi]TPW94066.1 hypothetical protein FJ656_34695 [Schumannella luteola]